MEMLEMPLGSGIFISIRKSVIFFLQKHGLSSTCKILLYCKGKAWGLFALLVKI